MLHLTDTLKRVDREVKRCQGSGLVAAGDVALLLLAHLARDEAQRDMVVSAATKREAARIGATNTTNG